MSKLHVRHIESKLRELYSDKIDTSDARNEVEKDNFFLTRAFAAYSLQVLSLATPEQASASIVDGMNDNGIDAIFYDKETKTLWLAQSKWIKDGSGEPSTGDTNKFKAGVLDLIDLKLDRFNEKVQAKENDIDAALNDYTVKIKIIMAYTGNNRLTEHNQRLITDLLAVLNDTSPIASFELFNLSIAHSALVNILDARPIIEEIALQNWGVIDTPYKTIYGAVNGSHFAQLWQKYRSKLFSNNIRDFIGNSDVNNDIRNTILHDPEGFFYYNNGVTVLCQSYNKKPIVTGRSTGQFEIVDLTVVNGAQTVGSIGAAYEINPEAVEKIDVFVKIISLEGCPPSFGNSVTQKTNTQNRIEKRDFVSLDAQHLRLQTDFALDNIQYIIKRTKEVPQNNRNCSAEDVIIAVACSLSDVNIAVTAKREVGKLWEQLTEPPYTFIINEELSALKAWRCVSIMRFLADIAKKRTEEVVGREKACLIHSNRFILHMILNNIPPLTLTDERFDFDKFVGGVLPSLVCEWQDRIYHKVEELFATSLMHQLFRNWTKCRTLKDELLKK